MLFVGQAEVKGVYGRYHSVLSNLANLYSVTGIVQRNACVGRLYPNYSRIIIICPLVVYIISWRGLAALLIIDWGQC